MISLEHLADGSVSDRNFQKLERVVPDTGGVSMSVRYGTGTTTYPGGSTFSNSKSITHGLGRAPRSVLITPFGSVWCTFNLLSIDATQFTVQFQANDVAVSPGAGVGQSFSWEVKG